MTPSNMELAHSVFLFLLDRGLSDQEARARAHHTFSQLEFPRMLYRPIIVREKLARLLARGVPPGEVTPFEPRNAYLRQIGATHLVIWRDGEGNTLATLPLDDDLKPLEKRIVAKTDTIDTALALLLGEPVDVAVRADVAMDILGVAWDE